ncbi:hypothetical protein KEM54_001124 [Ascosphaera aggregata]|nr:hypothetical protein KEM54_001124 [Ascosphaera aggregata]
MSNLTDDCFMPGGLLAPIGVPGLLLAGGVNYRVNQASAEFAANINDPKTHVVPAIIPGINKKPDSATVFLFYDSDTKSYPESLQMLTNLKSTASTSDSKTVKQLSVENAVTVIRNIKCDKQSMSCSQRSVFVAGTVKGTTYDELDNGISIVNNTFTEALSELYVKVSEENITVVELNCQPIGPLWTKASTERGGNPLRLNESQVYLCYAEVVMWDGEEYVDAVNSWVEENV